MSTPKLATLYGLRPEGWKPPAPVCPPKAPIVHAPKMRSHALMGAEFENVTKRTAGKGGGRCPKCFFVRYVTILLARKGMPLTKIRDLLEYETLRGVSNTVARGEGISSNEIYSWLRDRNVTKWRGIKL